MKCHEYLHKTLKLPHLKQKGVTLLIKKIIYITRTPKMLSISHKHSYVNKIDKEPSLT